MNTKLFERKGTHIELTRSGTILVEYDQKIEKLYNQLYFDLNILNQKKKGKLSIGASTTVTQYVLPELATNFLEKFEDISINIINGNTEQIELSLRKNEIDLGIIEGQSKRSEIHYSEFLEDEIVFVVRSSHPAAKKHTISLSELKQLPLVIRGGTREVISFNLKKYALTLNEFNISLEFGSTEGIKNYILNSDTVAVLSLHSILKELQRNELTISKVENFRIYRKFNFIFPQAELCFSIC